MVELRTHTPAMPQDATGGVFLRALIFVLLVLVVRAVMLGDDPFGTLAQSDSDDIMRYLSVRAWLDGQSWFDMTQYRALPPEGLSIHWSRFVDLGIAAIIVPLSAILPERTAEAVALVAWPTLLVCLFTIVTARTARAAFGPLAGAIAALAVIVWPYSGSAQFAVARIDHHNFQIVMMCLLLAGILLPEGPRWRVAGAGLAAAMSLAVGLEMLLFIGLAGMVMAIRAIADPAEGSARLVTFAAALAIGALGFFMAQTAPSDWATLRCDALSPGFLALAGVALTISLAYAALARRSPSAGTRAALFAGLAAPGLALVYPLLGPCRSGPYGDLPIEVQELIARNIAETISAARLYEMDPVGTVSIFASPIVALLAGTLIWARRARQGEPTARMLWPLLLIGWPGLILGIFQARLMIVAVPVVPYLAAVIVAAAFAWRSERPTSARSLGLIGAAALTLFVPALYMTGRIALGLSQPNESREAVASMLSDTTCRTSEIMGSLAALPQGTVLSTLNMGALILLETEHRILAAPYHRSAAAFWNGSEPFRSDADTLADWMERTGADYVLLCRGETYGAESSAGSRLARGEVMAPFVTVEGADPALVVVARSGP